MSARAAGIRRLIRRAAIVGLFFGWFGGRSVVGAESWQIIQRNELTLYHQLASPVSADRYFDGLLLQRDVVRKKLGHIPAAAITVYLTPSQSSFDEVTRGGLPHWSAAVAVPASRLIILKPGPIEHRAQTIQHEMSHVLLHSVVDDGVPVWFNEGVALWVSREWRLEQTASLFYAVLSGGLIPLSNIDSVLQFASVKADLAYSESLLAVLYLISLGGENALVAMISELSCQVPFDVALYRVTGKAPYEFEKTWNQYVSGRFGLTALLVSPDSLWGYLVLLFGVAYVAVRRRNRKKLRRWEEEDRLEQIQLSGYDREDGT
ncbi:MAG: peptidase MA family metallohydrolase [bacterium]|nr:peptidase MA family metallohydrolase [bacterium]